jgi:hypothetical protein
MHDLPKSGYVAVEKGFLGGSARMATTAIVLVGAALVAAAIAMEAGMLRLPRLRWREQRLEPEASAAQCVATTAGGDRCVRATANRDPRYCWQHRRMAQRVSKRSAPLASLGLVPRLTRR